MSVFCFFFLSLLICFFIMATFDLNQFIDQPSVEMLEDCRKNDLLLIAQHYDISIIKTQRKAEIKAFITAALREKGIVPATEDVQVPEVVADTEGFSRVPVVDPTTPANVAVGGVGPPFSLPKFKPVSLSSGATPEIRSDWRLKLRLACLQLEAQDRAQARQDDL